MLVFSKAIYIYPESQINNEKQKNKDSAFYDNLVSDSGLHYIVYLVKIMMYASNPEKTGEKTMPSENSRGKKTLRICGLKNFIYMHVS